MSSLHFGVPLGLDVKSITKRFQILNEFFFNANMYRLFKGRGLAEVMGGWRKLHIKESDDLRIPAEC